MDFIKELAKLGYNEGNTVDVKILIDEILPSLFQQQERSYSEEEVRAFTYNAFCLGQLQNPTENKFNEWFEQFKK